MIGDKLASGAPSATFTGPKIKVDPIEMDRDFHTLPAFVFREKYMITEREYDLMVGSDGIPPTNMLAKSMEDHLEIINRMSAHDQKQDESLKRDCPISPYIAYGLTGRVIASRDRPAVRRSVSRLALPRDLRKQREMLPSTGQIVRATVVNQEGKEIGASFLGKRIVWGGMSGQALCFDGYPTFIELELAEILGFMDRDDVKITEQELEPLT